MYSFLFTGLVFACAGALCALVGDLQKRVYVGLFSFLGVNAIIWVKFIYVLFSPADLAASAALFLLSHAAAASAYLGMVYFLDSSHEASEGGAALANND